MSLRSRIYALLTALVLITLMGGFFSMWYSYRMERVFAAIIEKNFVAFQSAQALETALVNQKGFVSYYFMDGDPAWLRRLGEYRQIFTEQLAHAQQLAENQKQKDALEQIERRYTDYITAKDRVIELYKAKERSAGAQLHRDVRNQFFEVFALCEAYKEIHLNRINAARLSSADQAHKLRIIAAAVILGVTLLAAVLFFVMAEHVLGPIRRLSSEASREGATQKTTNEIKALSHSVHGLIEDFDKTHSELEKSREHLLQTEKLALVGKLAAGMAHSIRNPFTSVKMRLFSLARSLQLTDTQKDDLAVISEEIRHIDTIVQNFLEFSRPPKLKMQPISPSSVVDSAIQLLEHRLKSYDVAIEVMREFPLPDIQADPEQLKEVIANLIVNACEAMEKGGAIVIREEERLDASLGQAAVIHISDNGPGISEDIREKVLQPFFTTKAEGTGLGLSIAARIVEEHHGRLEFTSEPGKGTTFSIALPLPAVA
ncbi:MAG: ATP-binding protein [Thermodesulfobacteriota bacterium]